MGRRTDINRALAKAAKGTTCQRCGNDFPPEVLEFHHRDPSTKIDEIGGSAIRMAVPLFKKELEKCDVLYRNCHRIVETT